MKYDVNYSLKDFAKRLTERVDVTDKLIHAFDELLLLVLNENPERPKSRESLMEKGLLEQPSALATLYESEKITANAHPPRYGYGCTYSDESDEADEFEDAVEDSTSVDLEALDIGGSANTCPAGFFFLDCGSRPL